MLPAPTTIATSTPRARTAATCSAIRSTSVGVGAVLEIPHQRLARELQQDALEAGLRRPSGLLLCRPRSRRSGRSGRSRRSWRQISVRSSSIVFDSCFSALTCAWSSRARFARPTWRAGPRRSSRRRRRACRPRAPSPRRCGARPRAPPRGSPPRRRSVGAHRRDVQRDLVGERLEVLVAGDEVGLALDLDHRPDLVVGVDVGGDDALARAPPARASPPMPGPSPAGSRSPGRRRPRTPQAPACSPSSPRRSGRAAPSRPRRSYLRWPLTSRARRAASRWAGAAAGSRSRLGRLAEGAWPRPAAWPALGARACSWCCGLRRGLPRCLRGLFGLARRRFSSSSASRRSLVLLGLARAPPRRGASPPAARQVAGAVLDRRRRWCRSPARRSGSRRRCPGSRSRPGLGSQLVSTRPMIGIRRRAASRSAISSVFRSMTKTASGQPLHVGDAAEVVLELVELAPHATSAPWSAAARAGRAPSGRAARAGGRSAPRSC